MGCHEREEKANGLQVTSVKRQRERSNCPDTRVRDGRQTMGSDREQIPILPHRQTKQQGRDWKRCLTLEHSLWEYLTADCRSTDRSKGKQQEVGVRGKRGSSTCTLVPFHGSRMRSH